MRRVLNEAGVNAGSGFSMPAPIKGWNAKDSLADMSPEYAIYLDNWFPSTTSVEIRKGSSLFATLPADTIPSPHKVKSLLNLAKADGTTTLFAACEDGIYNVTAGGTIAAVSSVATTNKWEHINITVAGVSYLWCCAGDGVNKARIYNGTTNLWTVLDGASVPALIGPTSVNVANVSIWKNRIILSIKDSLSFFYGPLNSVGGTFSEFPLGSLFQRGGYIVATGNWTLDAGNGSDDRFVAITSEGEVAIYAGTDPSDATRFNLIGIYYVGKPTGKRCFVKVAGELGVLVSQGLYPLSRAMQSATIDTRPAFTDKIQQAFNQYYNNYKNQYGWQAVLYSPGPAIVVNVPLGNNVSYQFVMNTITGAWCRFIGWSAECFVVTGDSIYFALSNKVYRAWTGTSDGTRAITASAKTAFSYGPARARVKQIKLVKPVMTADTPITVGLALDTDFKDGSGITGFTNFIQSVSRWDAAIWDTSVWSGGNATINTWRTVFNTSGKTFALRLQIQVKNISVKWLSTDYIAETGGLL